MIDFSKATGISDDYGVITQITDAAGNVLWAAGGKIVLEVEKITSDTYAGETTYTGEEFILLNIYPKTNGTVSVTYGGLTKTITDTSGAAEPNAQEVFFGTFKGVSDSVTTPESGELTIDGDYQSFTVGYFSYSSKNSKYCGCITSVVEWGNLKHIEDGMFRECSALMITSMPTNIEYIGAYAFYLCDNLALTSLPSGVTSIGTFAFYGCDNLALTSLPSGVTSIGPSAFGSCSNLTSITIPAGVTSIGSNAFYGCNNLTNVTILNGSVNIEASAFTSASGTATIYGMPNFNARDVFVGNNFGVWTLYFIIPNFSWDDWASLENAPASHMTGGENYEYKWTVFINGVCTRDITAVELSKCTSIGNYAFCNFTSLTNVTIPDSVTSIGDCAFYIDEFRIERTVNVLSTTPATLSSSYPFYSPSSINIIVPKGCGDIYKAAENWSKYANYITEAS